MMEGKKIVILLSKLVKLARIPAEIKYWYCRAAFQLHNKLDQYFLKASSSRARVQRRSGEFERSKITRIHSINQNVIWILYTDLKRDIGRGELIPKGWNVTR